MRLIHLLITDGFVLVRQIDSRLQIQLISTEGKLIFKGPQKEQINTDDAIQVF